MNDRILELLNHPTQYAGDVSFEDTDPQTCWRCERLCAALSPAGLCERCRVALRVSDGHAGASAPIVELAPWQIEIIEWMIAPRQMISPRVARSLLDVSAS